MKSIQNWLPCIPVILKSLLSRIASTALRKQHTSCRQHAAFHQTYRILFFAAKLLETPGCIADNIIFRLIRYNKLPNQRGLTAEHIGCFRGTVAVLQVYSFTPKILFYIIFILTWICNSFIYRHLVFRLSFCVRRIVHSTKIDNRYIFCIWSHMSAYVLPFRAKCKASTSARQMPNLHWQLCTALLVHLSGHGKAWYCTQK